MKRDYIVTIHSIGLATAIVSQGYSTFTNRKTVPLGQVEFYPQNGAWVMAMDTDLATVCGIRTAAPVAAEGPAKPTTGHADNGDNAKESAQAMVERVTKDNRYPPLAGIKSVAPFAPRTGTMPASGFSADAGRRLLKASVAAHDLSGGLDKYPEIDYGASMDFSSSTIKLEESDLK